MSEFHYRIPWRSGSLQPGIHPSRHAGSGQLFQRLANFSDYPDPRRLDLRASLVDPFENYRVRLHRQRAAIDVFAVVDLSASMAYGGAAGKLAAVADFIAALALSAHRSGDRLGVAAAGSGSKPLMFLPPSRHPAAAQQLAESLRCYHPQDAGAHGLARLEHWLPGRRALVFLLSDFHWPEDLARCVVAGLARHDVVPVALWERDEALPNASGLSRLCDLESGGERLLWLRPALRRRLADTFSQRRRHLTALLRRHGREPLWLGGGFDADAVTRYFHAGP
jgi:uncharacterized protein (DUF58 family)